MLVGTALPVVLVRVHMHSIFVTQRRSREEKTDRAGYGGG